MKAFAALLVLLLTAGACGASEWPTLGHDPQRTGSSETPGPQSPEIAWSVYVGAALTPPSVADHTVYFGAENVVYAVNAFNGSGLWGVEVDGAVSPPTVYNQKIYFGSSSGKIYCLNAKNGEILWSNQLSGGIFEPVAVVNDLTYACTSEGYVYALNATTGNTLWAKRLGGSPLAPAADERVAVVATREGEVTAFDRNGGIVWSLSIGDGVTSGPAIQGERVWIASRRKLCVVENGNTEDEFVFQTCITSFSIANGKAYVGYENGTVGAVEEGTVTWSFACNGAPPSSVTLAGNMVIAACGNTLFCLESGTGEEVWKTDIGGGPPAVAYGKVFVSSAEGAVYCIGSWGNAQNGSFTIGLVYLCTAALLVLALYALRRVKSVEV